jgi:serine O-acetyltransferase
MSIREQIIDYSKGDRLRLFWWLFAWRGRTDSQLLRDVQSFFLYRMAHRHGGYIGRDTAFRGKPVLPHGLHGVYISRFASIGEDCCIYQNVTIGEVERVAPRIGDHCLIGAGAVIVGNVRIGNHVRIGAGAVVCSDIPDYCTVVAQPPRVIEKGREP